MNLRPTLILSLLLAGAAPAQEAPPAKKPSFTVVRDLGITYEQAWNPTSNDWAKPPVLERIQQAMADYPGQDLPKAYLGRYHMLQGDAAKAEEILKPLKEEMAYFFRLQGCLERNDLKAFVALYDTRQACSFTVARTLRLKLALEAKDTARASEILWTCYKTNPKGFLEKLLPLGAAHNQPAWVHAELTKLAGSITTRGKDLELLPVIQAEQERVKVLYPGQIP